MKEFGEPSTKLEFGEFSDDMVANEGRLENKIPDHQRTEEADGSGEVEDGEKGGEPEPEPRKRTKPPTVDEYQWEWKVSTLGLAFMSRRTDQIPQPQLETTRRTFFL